MRNILKFTVLSLITACCLHNALAQTQVANVIIMLDLTGSTSQSDLEAEREATRKLLESFESLSPKPRVAIGTFNNKDGNDPTVAARILPGASLTQNYGSRQPATGLYQSLNTLPTPVGFTDIAAAIRVAQTELELNSNSNSRYIVLVTDGTANRPGSNSYSSCSACGCINANSVAKAVANEARQRGTRILAIHYAGTSNIVTCEGEPEKGLDFLKQELLTDQADVLESSQNLNPIFGKIACAIGCSDDDPCTVDRCDEANGTCVFAPNNADRDKDGIPDCVDQCKGNDLDLGTSCSATNGNCVISGTYTCGSTGELVCASSENIVSGCCSFSRIDVSASLAAIRQRRKEAKAAIKRSVRSLGKKDSTTKRLLRAFYAATKQAGLAELAIPDSFIQCRDILAISVCPSVAEESNYEPIRTEAKKAQRVLKYISRRARVSKNNKRTLKLVRRAIKAVKAIRTELLNLPAERSLCI